MLEDEKKFFDVLNTQSNYIFERSKSFEAKALNITLFTGAVLGLEYTLLYNFSNNVLEEQKDILFYLVAISTSFFFSSILLGIITFFESHNLCTSEILCSSECCDKKILELSHYLENRLRENECKVKSKERFFKSSLVLFILGILVIIIIFNGVVRYSVHS